MIIGLIVLLWSCKKDPPIAPDTPDEYENGVLVLNEGLFEQNNASITFYDGETSFQQVFKSENGRGLGDTANDFEGFSFLTRDYIIIAVDISSQIEIIDRFTLKTVAQFPMFDGINAREPRRVAISGTSAYVCNFDGTVAVIDLSSNSVETLINVGSNPDGIAVVGDYVYVSNSGGLNYPVYDSTISVIDIHTNSVVETFKTRINSTQMIVDNQNEIYLSSNGNYDDIPGALVRINTASNTVISEQEKEISSMRLVGDWIYFFNGATQSIERYNTISELFEGFNIIDLSGFETFHGMEINESKEEILCLDANGYVVSSTVRAYDFNGNFLYEFQAGLNSTDVLFNN